MEISNNSGKNEIFAVIEEIISNNDIVLFMKGTSDFPRCGYSGVVVRILQKLGVKFLDVDILEDEGMRHGIKEYTNWPTIPQLYVKGEFIGGADIIHQLYESGELARVLKEKNIESKDIK